MVDTLVLNLKSYEIGRNHLLTIQPPVIRPGGECGYSFDVNGQDAAKAYHNGEKFNVSMLLDKQGKPGLFVQTSLPRYMAENNTVAIDKNSAKEIIQSLESDLSGIGIKSNVKNSTISRMDLFRNAETKYSFDTYSPVLNLLSAKRMKSQEFGGQGFMYRNSRHEIVAYDKIQEMEHKAKKNHIEINRSIYAENLLRFEYRMKGHEKVESVTGFNTAGTLIENYDSLNDSYNYSMKETLFHLDGQGIEILQTKKLESLLSALKEQYPRSYMRRFDTLAAMQGYESYGGANRIKAVLESVSGNRMASVRFGKRIDKMVLTLAEYESKSIDIKATPIHELYGELKRLVLRAAA